ncbi:hypothetical protein L3K75_14400, partial [[Ruminococcus] lactaris]|nr:hypothetical protein [[Ruminococcus] lactaris]
FKNYGRSKTYSNVQNEQFQRRHFYVPFGEFVHLHMQYYDMSVERFFAIHYCLSAICRQAFLV